MGAKEERVKRLSPEAAAYRRKHGYTDEEVRHALAALAANLGNATKTGKQIGIPGHTLSTWKNDTYAQVYADLEQRTAAEVEAAIVTQARANAARSGRDIDKALEHTEKAMQRRNYDAVDSARVARDLSHVHSQSIDKMLTMTGRPNQITESRELVNLVKSLEADGVIKVVDSTAEEVSDVQEITEGDDAGDHR